MQKKILVKAKYPDISYSPYYYTLGDTLKTYLFTTQGKLLDSADDITLFSRGAVMRNIIDDDKAPANAKISFVHPADEQKTSWAAIEPCNVWVYDSLRNRTVLPGIISALHLGSMQALVNTNNKQGLYDISSGQYIVPAEYDSIILLRPSFYVSYKEGNYRVLDMHGKEQVFPKEILQADVVDTPSMNFTVPDPHKQGYTFLYNREGKMLLNNERSFGYLDNFIVLRNNPGGPNPKNFMQLADGNGKIVVPDISNVEKVGDGRYYKIQRVDTAKSRYIYIGIWDGIENKWAQKFDDPEKVDFKKELSVIRDKGKTAYYSKTGKLLSQHDDTAHFLSFEEPLKDFDLYDHAIRWDRMRKHFYAFKQAPGKPYIIYDEDGNMLGDRYDDILEPGGDSKYFSFRIGNKWGLADMYMKEVIPVVYDTNIYAPWQPVLPKLLFVVSKDGKKFYTDTTGKVLFSGKWFSYIQDKPQNGLWLAFDYKPKAKERSVSRTEEIEKMYLIDASGTIKKQWDIQYPASGYQTPKYQFRFTGGGKIIKTVENSNFRLPAEIYDPKTTTTKQVPYRITFTRGTNQAIVLLQCTNDKGEEGMVNASDMKIVVPFGLYEHFYTEAYTMPDGSHAMWLKGERTKPKSKTAAEDFARFMSPWGDKEVSTIGLYSENGMAYFNF